LLLTCLVFINTCHTHTRCLANVKWHSNCLDLHESLEALVRATVHNCLNAEITYRIYCKTLFFRHILISRFPYVENLLHFNFADFPVNFIKQFVFCFFWCLKQMLLSNFVRYYCLYYIIPISYHGRVDILCRQNHGDGQFQKFAVYLISRFCSNRENLMLSKYTCLQ